MGNVLPFDTAAQNGPSICVVTEGEAIFSDENEKVVLKQGESAFIPPKACSESSLSFHGNCTMYVASYHENPC
jgi:mannose-6-phosphate isomerase class I